ncbi:hypothetical protein F2Q69_00034272 [Brassica cretica]|uniref:Uncharacterized protein n=1 Tax=Brassica cretica TaxID=69181 RepID=A0A8S9SNK3_BRACR|nr:hypothetical protein F2Q69_00034272 [Brassica cretica]
MAATKMFFRYGFGYAGFSDLKDFWDDLPVSRLKYNALDDFQEVFQTTSMKSSKKSSGLPGSLLTKPPFHNRSERFDDLHGSRPSDNLHGSRPSDNLLPYDFQEVFQTTSMKSSKKSSGLPGSLLTKPPFHNRSERFDDLHGSRPSDNLHGSRPSDNFRQLTRKSSVRQLTSVCIKSFKLVVHGGWCIDGNDNIVNT